MDLDITQVRKFYDREPWLSFDPADSRKPGGFKVALYLISGKTQRGAFGDGTIHVIMCLIEKGPDGKPTSREVKKWSYDPEQALFYRVKKEQFLGYAYQLRCNWGDLDILGKEISIQIQFERNDGRMIASPPNFFRVPPA